MFRGCKEGARAEWLVQTHVCGHPKSYGTYSKYFGKPWQGWNVMNKNRATTRYCPAFPWNIPEMEGLSTRALDFQGLKRKNRWGSSPVKPPPAGLTDPASEQILGGWNLSRMCEYWGQGRGTEMCYCTQKVDFSFCRPRDPTVGDPSPAKSTISN